MHTTYRSTFTTIRVEGAILPPDLLQRIADGDPDLEGLTPESYHLAKGEKINEAVNRAWNRLLGAWTSFRAAAEKVADTDPGTTVTRERWLLPLFAELGYGRLVGAKAIEVEGQSFPISHSWMYTPIHLVGFHVDLDKRTAGVAGAARNSPHSLVQVLLNRSDAHIWGFVSNGLRLRILRDNASLTRQAYVEFDLQAMMEGQVYSDFVLLWLLCHQSRVEADKPEDYWLEKWSKAAAEQGTRALDRLRQGVEEAITALGRGLLAHSANHELRDKLTKGTLTAQDYYRQLLRMVYRLIFLFVAEDRGLLLDPNSTPEARDRYSRYYSTARLRRLAERRRGTRHADLFVALRLVMDKLASDAGCPELGLPALGGFLFSTQAVPDLEACQIANHDLLDAIRALAFATDKSARRAVDYKNLGAEELGSIYESLLELHPVLNGGGSFQLKAASGNERKTTGSFYTPTPLINVLLDSALDPVLDEACKKTEPEQALLALKVCDPASGSGHFLIAAAHRMARRLATLRTGDEEPSPEGMHHALRDVIAHCIYGVDVNPMAVELCKVSLWMEALEPGKPLSFLDAHIKCGNSLIGTMPHLDTSVIPDEAFTAVTGDDKKTATLLKKRNKKERESGQLSLSVQVVETMDDLARSALAHARKMNALPEENAPQVRAKAQEYELYEKSKERQRLKLEADLWTAAFFWDIKPAQNEMNILAPTQVELVRLRCGEQLNPQLVRGVEEQAEQLRFFHWSQEFLEVFERGGFDCVLSNPPWERIKLQEEEFFAARDPEIAAAPNKAARQKLIDKLPQRNPTVAGEFENAKHEADATSKFIRGSNRFPLTAIGDVNTYALFAEQARRILDANGCAGVITPTGLVTDDTTKLFFRDLIEHQAITQAVGFENEEFIFPGVHNEYKFCTFTITGESRKIMAADFVFLCRKVEHVKQPLRHFQISQSDLTLFNPNTFTCPIFRTRSDFALAKKIYERVPVLLNERQPQDSWGVRFMTMFHMANDSGLFFTREQMAAERLDRKGNAFGQGENIFLPLYEAKMIWQFDHRFASLVGKGNANGRPSRKYVGWYGVEATNPEDLPFSRYWIAKADAATRLGAWNNGWLLGFRDVTSGVVERTAIFSVLPRVGVGHKIPLIFFDQAPSVNHVGCFLGNANSLLFDYLARQKVGGTSMSYFILKQLPTLPPAAYSAEDFRFAVPRVLELVFTSWDIKAFADDMWRDADESLRKAIQRQADENCAATGGHKWEPPEWAEIAKDGIPLPPFKWDEDRRAHLRAELDAYYARLYGLTRDELRYILDPKDVYGEDFPGETFRVLKEKEIKQYGEYRTRRLVLEKWDEMVAGK